MASSLIRKIALVAASAAGAGIVVLARRRRMRCMSFKNASVVITGGSRGLGLALAAVFAREGARLSLLARNEQELRRAQAALAGKGGDVLVYQCDVRQREEVLRTIEAIVGARGGIDVLINNAGIIQVAPLENLELQDFVDSMEVHAWGPLYMVHAVMPYMKRQGKGRIVNISSIGGLVAVPHLMAYCMGKFALTALSDGLRAELAKDGILVTTVAPGLMRTGSHVNAFFKGQNRKEFAWFSISGTNPLISSDAGEAARSIVNACRYGDARLIVNIPARMLHAGNANFPGLTSSAMKLAARLLPRPVPPHQNRLRTGWESRSPLSPSLLTRLGDRVLERNNEL